MSQQPKKAISALSAVGLDVDGIHLREFTASTLILLQKIGSPLLLSPKERKRKPMTNMDLLRLVFILAHPPAESFALLSGDQARFDGACVEFGDGLPISSFPKMGKAIATLFERAASTAPSGPALKKKEDKPAPTSGPGERSPNARTGSAGS